MFTVLIVSHDAESSHEILRTRFAPDAILFADHAARHWHDTGTTFEVWRGGNCFHSARPVAVKQFGPPKPANV